jgi:16S rRNA (cytidine1402-2'-O)-methyltransferase
VTGTLVLVATPIGNLGDLSPRAVEELAGAALICCEDTRRTGKLLVHAGITGVRMKRLDDHTERAGIAVVLDHLAGGQRVVLVSDAGTPAISDPGERLVAAVVEAGHTVTTVPGPSAVIAALVASGLATSRFVYEGFIARKGGDRTAALARIAQEGATSVMYESPNRLAATLRDLAAVCGSDRQAVVARELTKLHEEFVRGSLEELAEWADAGLKGEIVLVIAGATPALEADDDAVIAAIQVAMEAGLSRRDAIAKVVSDLGIRRGRAYDLALTIPGGVTPPP